jgi:hypothetical protein
MCFDEGMKAEVARGGEPTRQSSRGRPNPQAASEDSLQESSSFHGASEPHCIFRYEFYITLKSKWDNDFTAVVYSVSRLSLPKSMWLAA